MGIDSDLIRGHIDTIILKTLQNGDLYGYEICKEVEEKTNGSYELKQPTLYSCLKRLEDQKLISSYWKDSDIGGRRHYYKLTTKGQQTLDKNQEDWIKSRSIIDSLIYAQAPSLSPVPEEKIVNDAIVEEAPAQENDEITENIDDFDKSSENIEDISSTEETKTEGEVIEDYKTNDTTLNEATNSFEDDEPLEILNFEDEPLDEENLDEQAEDEPLQITNTAPLQIENEDPLQIEDTENPLLLTNTNTSPNEEKQVKTALDKFFDDDDDDEPLVIEDTALNRIEDDSILQIENEETKKIEDKEPPLQIENKIDTNINNYKFDEEQEEKYDNPYDIHDYGMSEENCPTHFFNFKEIEQKTEENNENAEFFEDEVKNYTEIEDDDFVTQDNFLNQNNLQKTVDAIVENSVQTNDKQKENNQDLEQLNIDDERFDVSSLLNKNKSFFNSDIQKDTIHTNERISTVYEPRNEDKDEPEIKEFNAFGADAFTKKDDEDTDSEPLKEFNIDSDDNFVNEDEDNDPIITTSKNEVENEVTEIDNSPNYNSLYESDESEFRYESPSLDYLNETNKDLNINNVEFQSDDDKAFTDEIMLSFSEQNEKYNLERNNKIEEMSIENSRKLSDELNENVRFAEENAHMIASNYDAQNNEDYFEMDDAPINEQKEQETAEKLENLKENAISPRSISALQTEMNKVGIVVKPYVKQEHKNNNEKDYLLSNKIKFVRSGICACLIAFLLSFSYIVLSNYTYISTTAKDTIWLYAIAIAFTILIAFIDGIIYFTNPYKKKAYKYAFRLSFLFGLLFFIQSLVIIFATNIMLGFVSFAQVDYNHAYWIVPTIVSLWFMLSPIIYNALFAAKKCCA